MKLCGQKLFFSRPKHDKKVIDNRSPHHDHHPLHLMDHPSSCRSAEIAPNQSEVRWALADLVPKPTCCFRSQMWTLSKPWGPCPGGPWLDRVPNPLAAFKVRWGPFLSPGSTSCSTLDLFPLSSGFEAPNFESWFNWFAFPRKFNVNTENADDSDCRTNY